MVEQTVTEFTDDEAELYDRQIRLWGLDAQKRLRASKVLVVGAQGLGAEVCKNIVLAGIKSLTLLDNTKITSENCGSQFLVDAIKDVGKNIAECSAENLRQLNPMVEIAAVTDDVDSKPDVFFAGFDVVVLTNCSRSTCIRLDSLCRKHGIKVFVADVFGVFGFMFVDLGKQHEYVEELARLEPQRAKDDHTPPPHKKPHADTVIKKSFVIRLAQRTIFHAQIQGKASAFYVYRHARYMMEFGCRPKISDAANLLKIRDTVLSEGGFKLPTPDSDDDYSSYCCAELNVVCAIVGGVIAQEIIKAVSHKGRPYNNFFFFNGRFDEFGGVIENIG